MEVGRWGGVEGIHAAAGRQTTRIVQTASIASFKPPSVKQRGPIACVWE